MSCIKVADPNTNWDDIKVAAPYLDKDGNTTFKIMYGSESNPLYVDLGEYNTPFGASQYKRSGEPTMTLSVGNEDRRDAEMHAQVNGINAMKKAIIEKMVKTDGYKLRGLQSTSVYTAEELEKLVSGPIGVREKFDEKTGSLKKFEPEMKIKFRTIRSPTNSQDHIGLVERYDENATTGSKGLPLIINVSKNEQGKEVKKRMPPVLADIDKLLPKQSRVRVIAQLCHVYFQKMKSGETERKGSIRIDAICVVRLGDATTGAPQVPPSLDEFNDLALEGDEDATEKEATVNGANDEIIEDEEEEEDEDDEEIEAEDDAEDSDASAYTKAKAATKPTKAKK